MTRLWKNQAFTVAHADNGKFVGAGLRVFFEYRGLGIAEATGGKFGAHVIRAVPGMKSPGKWRSDDLKLIQISSPANFATGLEAAPE